MANIIEFLYHQGAININWVGGEPTPNIPAILSSLKITNLNIAQLWNSNMYLSDTALDLVLDVVDIWLPDFKYGSDECALRLSKAPNYTSIVTRNLKKIYEEGGGNIIIRVLVLPNHYDCCTYHILTWIRENTPNVLVNIMRQYRPMWKVRKEPEKYREISSPTANRDMLKAYALADELKLMWRAVS